MTNTEWEAVASAQPPLPAVSATRSAPEARCSAAARDSDGGGEVGGHGGEVDWRWTNDVVIVVVVRQPETLMGVARSVVMVVRLVVVD